MSEMIEIVARSICSGRGINPDSSMGQGPPHLVYGGYIVFETLPAWRLFAGDAVAAIRAMCNPTVAMCRAAEREDISKHDVEVIWRDMAEAALT